MKKLLMIILLAFTALNSNASTVSNIIDSATATTKSIVNSTVNGVTDAVHYTDTSSNFRLLIQKGESMVLFLAESFKTSAKYVLYIIGKKYFLMGIYAWVLVVFGIIVSIVSIVKLNNNLKQWVEEYEALPIILFIVTLMFSIACVSMNLQNAINYTFNPQYYVLQEVIEMVKTLKQ